MNMVKRKGRLSRLSGRIWLLIVIWVVCLLYLLFQGGKTSVMLLSMVTLLCVYLWIVGLSGVRRVQGSRQLSQGSNELLHAGDQVHVKLSLSFPGFLPLPYIIVREVLKRHTGESWSFEDSVIPSLKEGGELTFQTPALERGSYHFEETECVSEDIFGLLEHKGRLNARGEFRVLPRTVFIPYWLVNERRSRMSGPQTVQTRTRRETTQINGVRDYVYGDRFSRIHWNATARTGSWKSKEFEHETVPKTMLVLDLHTKHYINADQFELAVSSTASLLEYGGRERMGIGLCTAGEKGTVFQPSEQMMERQRMMHYLVDIHLTTQGSLMAAVEGSVRLFPPGCFFVLISPLKDQRALELLRWADTRGMTPCHVHIGEGIVESKAEEWISMLRTRGIRGYHIPSLEDLPAVLGGGTR
ncbi:DUF58 domain-containing protein [Paenibacillus farraposensis]|uniref:DUF58 domain-containing protein n=1 Tax=Paenibacillus farraposensis TaxID=2807095 RepID=A0ABW4DA92_9BACL|nr:DUF58 domain-containing protein [Paenibacillus farraposensis]MCC3380127.1 DUF58 domain-containing protein [Paenibacillus farraposensis]